MGKKSKQFLTAGLLGVLLAATNGFAAATLNNNSSNANNSSGVSNAILQQIANNTRDLLANFNQMPGIFESLTKLAMSWLQNDKSEATAQMQASFGGIGLTYNTNTILQNSQDNAIQLTADMLTQPDQAISASQFKAAGGGKPDILNVLPWINDIAYPTMLGFAPVQADGVNRSPYSYILNASGMNIKHVIPGQNWQGKQKDQAKYGTFFATISSIENFNGYILKKLAGEAPISTLQSNLITQASSSKWIAEIGTQDLGVVLRQMLMFSAQTYVLLAQIAQTQRDLLTAQTMTNTLLIINNQPSESVLAARAQGINAINP